MELKKIEDCAEILSGSKYTVAFTGAGVSTESGVPDFRSPGGVFDMLREKYQRSPEEILSIDFFVQNTALFYQIHKSVFLKQKPLPSGCHKAFARLEEMGIMKSVITQNIDNLHQDAGSHNVWELHGNMFRNICSDCGKNFPLSFIEKSADVPHCDDCNGVVRPDIVFYGESLDFDVMEASVDEIKKADTLIVAGTSLRVYPAAGLINYFAGKNMILINRDRTPYDSMASIVINDMAGAVMEKMVEKVRR